MDQIKLKAHGKINLALDVTRKREDGYHEVRMIMQTVGIYDAVTVRRVRTKDAPPVEITTNVFFVPTNENNIAYKAARLLIDEFGITDGIQINIRKFIPVAAGMAGGSTDAATVLYAINRIFNLGLTTEQLMERGVKLGADVPYCLMRGTVLAEGIGEKLTPLNPAPQCYILLAKPPISVSTRLVYDKLNANEIKDHPDIDGMIEAINEGDIHKISDKMDNVLARVTEAEYPVVGEIRKAMMDCGAINSMMSGSGPTVFGLFETEEEMKNAYTMLKGSRMARQVYTTEMYNPVK